MSSSGFPTDREVDERAGRKMLREAIPTAIVGVIGGIILFVIVSSCATLWPLACLQFSFIEFMFDTFDIAVFVALVLFGSLLLLKSSDCDSKTDRTP